MGVFWEHLFPITGATYQDVVFGLSWAYRPPEGLILGFDPLFQAPRAAQGGPNIGLFRLNIARIQHGSRHGGLREGSQNRGRLLSRILADLVWGLKLGKPDPKLGKYSDRTSLS